MVLFETRNKLPILQIDMGAFALRGISVNRHGLRKTILERGSKLSTSESL